MRAARSGSSHSPGSPSSSSSSARRSFSRSGSKVITDPRELGPDLLELLLQWLVDGFRHSLDGSGRLTPLPAAAPGTNDRRCPTAFSDSPLRGQSLAAVAGFARDGAHALVATRKPESRHAGAEGAGGLSG